MELDSTLQGDPRTIAERIASESLIRELYADAGLFGSSFLSEIELETAESTLTLAGTMNPSLEIRPEEDSRRLVAHNLYFRGQASAYSDQDWSGALTLFEQARSLEPRLERIDRAFRAARLMMEGYDLAGLGEIDAALAKYEQAIAIEPALFKSWLDPRGVYAAMFVLEGQAQANQGNVDAATASFERAMLLDPALAIEPEQVARSIFALVLVDQGGTLAQQGDIETAVANFAEALDLDPALDILAYNWNTLCWFGSLHGHAALVLDACEQAVLESPDDGRYRQSRGLARALTGNTAGAIEDLQYYVTWAEQNWNNEEEIQQREAWIAALQAGENPFDQETLEALLIE